MAELNARIKNVRGRIAPVWSPKRSEDIWNGVILRKRRQTYLKYLGAASVGATILLLVFVLGMRPSPVRFADGSKGTLLRSDSSLRRIEERPDQVRVALDSGSVRFQITRNQRRLFRVEAGSVFVEVLGTQFVVTRTPSHAVVQVEEGRVRVRWPEGETILTAGESGTFPRPKEPGPRPEEPKAAGPKIQDLAPPLRGDSPLTMHVPLSPVQAKSSPPRKPPQARWQDLAQEGDYDRAFGALKNAPAPRDIPQELLLASDVARLSHHPEEAIAPLAQFLSRHRADRRAPLAAFTLGRILLDELGRPGAAAEAFQTVQELDPGGPLHQDALAREVESWSRAGDEVRARERALTYVQRYPKGPRLLAVRRHGGLD